MEFFCATRRHQKTKKTKRRQRFAWLVVVVFFVIIGGDWDKSCSSGIWDGKNADSTIGNEMVNEWTDSGKWDGRKSVKVRNEMGSEWADSGTGTVYLAVGEETREHKSVTGEVGKHRSGKEISFPFPFPFPYRSRPLFPSRPLPRGALCFTPLIHTLAMFIYVTIHNVGDKPTVILYTTFIAIVVSHIQRIGRQPEKTTLHSGQSRSSCMVC